MEAQEFICKTVDSLDSEFLQLNKTIHDHPELAYKEVFAHDTITTFLESQGFNVEKHTYGLGTSFEAEVGSGGRLVIFCAEYDALPNIGHACGHNLIATSSIAAFVAVAKALQDRKISGRVRILGTPAEEGGGGKIKLIEAGAFKDNPAAAIMSHPVNSDEHLGKGKVTGVAGPRFIASYKIRTEYRGKAAHAAAFPWRGLNALDAAVAAYNNVSLLRQQIEPDDRIHGVIEHGGTVPNVIPDYTRMSWNIRSPSTKRCNELVERVKACFSAAALATGCELSYKDEIIYTDLRANPTLCHKYSKLMSSLPGEKIIPLLDKPVTASTDMGNVSYTVPSFHGVFAIPTPPNVVMHQAPFAEAAAGSEAHQAALQAAKGMAMLAWSVLTDDQVAQDARRDFERVEDS